ncbi:hypothetical protein ACVINH_005922 [Rhizobium anhuiense]
MGEEVREPSGRIAVEEDFFGGAQRQVMSAVRPPTWNG